MCAMEGLEGAGALLRPCTYLEELCEKGHLSDSLLTSYVLRLRSTQTLTRTQVMNALIHLRRCVLKAMGGVGLASRDGIGRG